MAARLPGDNNVTTHDESSLKQLCGTHGKRNYQTPALLFFGKVSSLTQSASGCNQGDNPACTGTVGSNMGPMASDRSIKENIVKVAEHPLGVGLYLFDYKPQFRDECGHGRHFGTMAQDVETVMPEAVSLHPNGYKMVDYGMLGFTRSVR